MPATALRCRACGAESALEAVGTCSGCFGPLEPVYDPDELAHTFTREGSRPAPPRSGATPRSCPSPRRRRPASPPA